MNFENLLLRGLFGACVLVCALMLAAMATATPASVRSHTVAAGSTPMPASGTCSAG